MKVIWKYPVPVDDHFVLKISADHKVLTVQLQDGAPQVWVVVDPDAQQIGWQFKLLGTGHPFDDDDGWEYVGTFQLYDGRLVLHLFEAEAA